jgi:hypothetical protein
MAGPAPGHGGVTGLACYLALHLGGTRPDGSPCILITSSWVIDAR